MIRVLIDHVFNSLIGKVVPRLEFLRGKQMKAHLSYYRVSRLVIIMTLSFGLLQVQFS